MEAPERELGWQTDDIRVQNRQLWADSGWLTMLHVTPILMVDDILKGHIIERSSEWATWSYHLDATSFGDYKAKAMTMRHRQTKAGVHPACLYRPSDWNDIFRGNEIVYWLYGKGQHDPYYFTLNERRAAKKASKNYKGPGENIPGLEGLAPLIASAIGEWGRKVNRIMLKGQAPKPIQLFDGDDGRTL
jgi:hypothetical protein